VTMRLDFGGGAPGSAAVALASARRGGDGIEQLTAVTNRDCRKRPIHANCYHANASSNALASLRRTSNLF